MYNMAGVIDKLSTYAALVGVVAAIGGGFYAWGEFNSRLNATDGYGNQIQELVEWKKDTIADISTLEARMEAVMGLDTTLLEGRLAELETKMERVRSDIRDNKNDGKDDLNDAYDAISDVERALKDQKKEIKEILKDFEEAIQKRIERALDNPLSG